MLHIRCSVALSASKRDFLRPESFTTRSRKLSSNAELAINANVTVFGKAMTKLYQDV